MKFAVNIPTSGGGSASAEYSMLPYCTAVSWADQREFAATIETLGFDGIGVPDHLMTGDGATIEATTVLAGLAEVTDTVTLFPKTINNELRHGPLLAKMSATLDNICGGRFKLGMGAGWKTDEAKAYGYDWPDAPTRLRKMEETVELTKRLWTENAVDYQGDYYELNGAVCTPHPLQDPHPPIMIGGGGENFTLRITAKHADEWNYWGSHHLIKHKLDVLSDHCATYNTDYDAISKSWFARCAIRETEREVESLLNDAPRFKPENLDDDENHLIGTPSEIIGDIKRYADLGIDEIVVEFVDFPESTGAEIFSNEVLPQFSWQTSEFDSYPTATLEAYTPK